MNLIFDYTKEPSRDILCLDIKSFYASVECVERRLNPLTAKLVVMSYPSEKRCERGSGLILASSPAAKKAYGISNVSRARDLPFPYPKDLVIVPPQMRLYMEKNKIVNQIYQEFADEKNHHVYSIDESFIDVTDGLKMYHAANAYELAQKIQKEVYQRTGLYTTVGIGDNPLLAKLALDNESKQKKDMKAQWRYKDVPRTVWQIPQLTNMWGIGKQTAKKLEKIGIYSVYELAHYNYYDLKEKLGVLGGQLYAHAWGIDRTFLGDPYQPKNKSVSHSQILPRDYTLKKEIEVVIQEMGDQIATRLRAEGLKTHCVGLSIGYSLGFIDKNGKRGFHQQKKVPLTNSSKVISELLLRIFNAYYEQQDVRQIGVQCSDLVFTQSFQLNFFEEPEKQLGAQKLDIVVDRIREKYGFEAIIHAHSLLAGGRALERSRLVGGHAGGMAGIEGSEKDEAKKESKNI